MKQIETAPTSYFQTEEMPRPVSQVMEDLNELDTRLGSRHYRALPTGFIPLDDVLNGGIRAGELMLVGGAFGVGKTIFALQVARNVVATEPDTTALYVCYEHSQVHLLSRLLCLESAEQGLLEHALTLRKLAQLPIGTQGRLEALRRMPRYASTVQAIEQYADRLWLMKASGRQTGVEEIASWAEKLVAQSPRVLLVVDYLQKIPVQDLKVQSEIEATTILAQALKELAMRLGLRVIAIAAADREGLKAKRMRLSDLRGSSALQYEADIGLILNSKFNVVSREHLVFNLSDATAMRQWVVMSVEKNRAGRHAVDMEYRFEAPHFRFNPNGTYVREQLIDEKVILA